MSTYIRNIKRYFKSINRLHILYEMYENWEPKRLDVHSFLVEIYLLHCLSGGKTVKELRKGMPKQFEKVLTDVMIVHIQKRPMFDWKFIQQALSNANAWNAFTETDQDIKVYQNHYFPTRKIYIP